MYPPSLTFGPYARPDEPAELMCVVHEWLLDLLLASCLVWLTLLAIDLLIRWHRRSHQADGYPTACGEFRLVPPIPHYGVGHHRVVTEDSYTPVIPAKTGGWIHI
ncbi:MAG TPA: hypothetical protein VN285_11000 [Candidatus Deferrimicrobium sp.]|nr:hypothetical protein [Candidatus Deferrimicrobium sp.]